MISVIINLIFPGSGLFWHNQKLQGMSYLVGFGLLNVFRTDIGAIWAIYVFIMAQVHFYKVKNAQYQEFAKKDKALIWLITCLVIIAYYFMYGLNWTNNGSIKYPVALFSIAILSLLLPALNLTLWLKKSRIEPPPEVGQENTKKLSN
ncbi:MAG: hypothetical protein HYV65_02485 [Candidatus Spechtbacteria bacterium]|nr:hypothetical protein [Candidatus Spechtbacteria bacterium]